MYNRRLLPYHAFSVVAGIDDEGLGAAFTYDAVGSFERGGAVCSGRAQVRTRPFRNTEALIGGRGSFCAQALIQPILDRLPVASATHLVVDASCETALAAVKDAFRAAAERDISLGDSVEVLILESGRTRHELITLPAD